MPPTMVQVVVCSAVLSACGRCQQWRRALQLLEDLPKRRIRGNVVTYFTNT